MLCRPRSVLVPPTCWPTPSSFWAGVAPLHSGQGGSGFPSRRSPGPFPGVPWRIPLSWVHPGRQVCGVSSTWGLGGRNGWPMLSGKAWTPPRPGPWSNSWPCRASGRSLPGPLLRLIPGSRASCTGASLASLDRVNALAVRCWRNQRACYPQAGPGRAVLSNSPSGSHRSPLPTAA